MWGDTPLKRYTCVGLTQTKTSVLCVLLPSVAVSYDPIRLFFFFSGVGMHMLGASVSSTGFRWSYRGQATSSEIRWASNC